MFTKSYINGLSIGYSAPLTLGGGNSCPNVSVDSVPIENLVGVEIYSGIPGQPAQFGPRTHCGAVVLWTY